MINFLPKILTDEQRSEIDKTLTIEKVKAVVSFLNKDNASGPDSSRVNFLKIVGTLLDMVSVVMAFFVLWICLNILRIPT